MSGSKILLGVTGSIAAYKSAYLISRLVQNGYEVKVVATDSALKFVGKATFEGLTGNIVYTDSFADGEMMSHITLVKWADLTIICPATANTINKLASGSGENLLTSLFLAHDWTKPYLIAPAMNTNMYMHPATLSSIEKLKSWGVNILPSGEGYLACGDIGKGKLIEPDFIYQKIVEALNNKDLTSKRLRIIITAGGTQEKIDDVRFITNLSTGKTAAVIADHLIKKGHEVKFIHSSTSALPKGKCEQVSFTDYKSLFDLLEKTLRSENYDAIIHNSAVSDYSLDFVDSEGKKNYPPFEGKLKSESEDLVLHLKRNEKILDKLKQFSKNKNIRLVSFKFTVNESMENIRSVVLSQLEKSNGDLVVQNDTSDRLNGEQTNFRMFNKNGEIASAKTSAELAEKIEELIVKNPKESL